LDIGSIGNYDDSLYYQLKPFCKSMTGTDIRQSEDKDIIQADMQTHNLNKKFDVIIAGDVIEHLDNQGLFIENMKRHLKENGKLIITTPNFRSLNPFLKFMSKGFKTHTLWHDKETITFILEKYDFDIEEIFFYAGNRKQYNLFNYIPILNKNMLCVVASKNGNKI